MGPGGLGRPARRAAQTAEERKAGWAAENLFVRRGPKRAGASGEKSAGNARREKPKGKNQKQNAKGKRQGAKEEKKTKPGRSPSGKQLGKYSAPA